MTISKEELLKMIDGAIVRDAIARAEQRTTGEICVSVAPTFWGSVEEEAKRVFVRLGVARTRDRNGVLFFVVPGRRKLVVLGDIGIHALVGDAFWERVASDVSIRFALGDFTGGLLSGINQVTVELERHFPAQAGREENELTNEIQIDDTAVALRLTL